MISYKVGTCTECGTEAPIVKKILPNKYCYPCNQARLRDKKPKKEPSGEYMFFEALWNVRPHVSWISGVKLEDEMDVMYCFHVLGKGAYPGFRLYDKNLIFTTAQEHWDWHNLGRTQLLEKNPNWKKVFDLEQDLKEEYYNSKT